jgi:hypothetical protein
MGLAAGIVLFAAASLIVVCAVFMLRIERMPWRGQKLVLGMRLPEVGESGSITEAEMRALSEQGVITSYQTWLSTEQASLLLECGAYLEALWSRSMGIDAPLPKEARRTGLTTLLGHGSYCDNARMWVRHEAQDIDPPDDACGRHMASVLRQWAPTKVHPKTEQDPVMA